MLDSIARSLVDSGRLAKFIEPKKEKEHKEYKPKKQITKKHD
jgi:N utilization substance protein B